ncbi:MAG TPA: shikimate dehydrogenase [Dehalococcoidia bacterium]|nr:shikimate dehydrogenase [Dehalococcoidia bacterium]
MAQYIGVIGYPLKHSLSPDFQQAALDYYQLDIHYEVWETKVKDLSSRINQLRQPQNLGANVTVPYKETALHLIDEVDNLASLIGAVNTIANRDGKLVGFNTDAHGFLQALRDDGKFEPENKCVVILGAGGAARAVSFALLQENVTSLVIMNRTPARAEALVDRLTEYAVDKRIRTEVIALLWQDSRLREALEHCQLIVNCTTLGMEYSSQQEQSPLTADLIPKGALVYELVYNPSETPLLRMAREAGAGILGGLPMLVHQGAASFKLWTGKEAPLDIMFLAAKQALLKVGGEA